MLIVGGRLGLERHQKLSWMVFVIRHRAIKGEEIDMHVIDRHENGDLTALLMEILILHHDLVSRHYAIGRRQHRMFHVGSFTGDRDTEKANDQCAKRYSHGINQEMPPVLVRP